MSKNNSILCSLFVINEKPVTRLVAGSILRPYRGNLIRFKTIKQLEYALSLEEENQVSIKTPIPQHVLALMNGEVVVEEETEVAPVYEQETFDVEVVTDDKPEWYLSWDEVEKLSKAKLQKHFAEVEGIELPNSKSAGETKELVHEFLSSRFPNDHIK